MQFENNLWTPCSSFFLQKDKFSKIKTKIERFSKLDHIERGEKSRK